jgi:hypothetical protein
MDSDQQVFRRDCTLEAMRTQGFFEESRMSSRDALK